jgi:hypothetical protein
VCWTREGRADVQSEPQAGRFQGRRAKLAAAPRIHHGPSRLRHSIFSLSSLTFFSPLPRLRESLPLCLCLKSRKCLHLLAAQRLYQPGRAWERTWQRCFSAALTSSRPSRPSAVFRCRPALSIARGPPLRRRDAACRARLMHARFRRTETSITATRAADLCATSTYTGAPSRGLPVTWRVFA